MEPQPEDNVAPLDQADLEKIPNTTMSKSMANVEDLMAEYIANGEVNLDPNEKRLIDRQVFEKTGKHIGKFKNPKPSKTHAIPMISADGKNHGQKDGTPTNMKVRKNIPVVPANPKANAGVLDPAIS